MKFCILSLIGPDFRVSATQFSFFLHNPGELESPEKTFSLTPEEIKLLNPNTGTCPVFRSRRDAEITLGIHHRVPVLLDDSGKADGNTWGVSFNQGLFNASHDSHLFRPSSANSETLESMLTDGWEFDGNALVRGAERLLPLYEAKMLHHYDHRWATYSHEGEARDLSIPEKQDPGTAAYPRYWVAERDIPTGAADKNGAQIRVDGVSQRLANRGWTRDWLISWRDICRATDERTMINAVIPRAAAPNATLLMFPSQEPITGLVANLSSFALDFAARQKVGGTHLSFFTAQQLPILTPQQIAPHADAITPRILELTYTAHDMAPFARDLGDAGTPFRWDEDRRAVIRAELDALFFHLYGLDRDDTAYVLDTFPIVKRKDKEKYGTYRTKDLILAEYDRMEAAGLTLETPLTEGKSGTYRSTLTPPPGHGPRHPALGA
jgi:hypothetical protein